MSFRDLRNFSEHIRVLGYPKQISLESFREPNFPLMFDILQWLAERFDPDAKLVGGYEKLEDRISFIRAVAVFMITKANIKLNTKKLYRADGYALREMLKITTVLYNALHSDNSFDKDELNIEDDLPQFDLSSKANSIKTASQLATDITAQGNQLFDLLAKETEYKEKREQSLSRQLDISRIEHTMKQAVASLKKQIEVAQEEIENVAAREAALDSKIERRRGELERAERRLMAVHKIKPAYMVEYKALEAEIEKLFDEYILRYRCVEALKQELSMAEKAQTELAEEQQKAVLQLITKYEAEDVLVNVSDSDSNEELDGEERVEAMRPSKPAPRLRIRTAVRGGGGRVTSKGGPRAFGDLLGSAADELDDDDDAEQDFADDITDEIPTAPSRYATRARRFDTAVMSSNFDSFNSRTGARTPPNYNEQLRETHAPGTSEAGDSLASSDESELQVAGRNHPDSDNEF